MPILSWHRVPLALSPESELGCYTEPPRDLIPRHSLDTFRQKKRKGIGEQTVSQASFLPQSLGESPLPSASIINTLIKM